MSLNWSIQNQFWFHQCFFLLNPNSLSYQVTVGYIIELHFAIPLHKLLQTPHNNFYNLLSPICECKSVFVNGGIETLAMQLMLYKLQTALAKGINWRFAIRWAAALPWVMSVEGYISLLLFFHGVLHKLLLIFLAFCIKPFHPPLHSQRVLSFCLNMPQTMSVICRTIGRTDKWKGQAGGACLVPWF